MYDCAVSTLNHGLIYEMGIGGHNIRFELRKVPPGCCSILTKENGNPVGYLDLGPPKNIHLSIETDKGRLSEKGLVLSRRHEASHLGYDDVSGGFTGVNDELGFFLHEQYRGKGIGSVMLGIAIEMARQHFYGCGSDESQEAYLMVWSPMRDFPRSPFYEDGRPREGVGIESPKTKDPGSILLFPEFEMPTLSLRNAKEK